MFWVFIYAEERTAIKGEFGKLEDEHFSSKENLQKEMDKFFAEYFLKEPLTGKDLKNIPDSLLNYLSPKFSELKALEKTLASLLPSVKSESELLRTRLSYLFENSMYDDFLYFTASIDGIFPVAGAFVTGYLDNVVAPFNNGYVIMPKYAVTFFPEPSLNRTVFIFGAFKDNPNVNIFYSQLRIKSDLAFKKFISNLILQRGANTYFSPRFWAKLTNEEKGVIIERKKFNKDADFGLYDLGLNLFDQKYME